MGQRRTADQDQSLRIDRPERCRVPFEMDRAESGWNLWLQEYQDCWPQTEIGLRGGRLREGKKRNSTHLRHLQWSRRGGG